MSACAMIWLHGKTKYAHRNSRIGFHIGSYTTEGLVDIYLEDDLDGVQDAVQEGMAYDILKLMESPVSNPLKFVEMHMLYGWRSDRFWVLQERDAWIIGNVSYYGTKG